MWKLRTACVTSFALVLVLPAGSFAGTVTCQDGTTAKSGRGAYSHHGGVAETASTPPAAAPQSPRATVPTTAGAAKSPAEGASAGSPVGATARCKDGTYSHAARHEGACSHHGGVAQWLD